MSHPNNKGVQPLAALPLFCAYFSVSSTRAQTASAVTPEQS